MFKYLLIAVLCLPIFKASGTTQEPDRIIIGRDTFYLTTPPFETLDSVRYKKFQQQVCKGNSRKINAQEEIVSVSRSSLWRGYVATWELRNDSLIFYSATNFKDKPIAIPEIIAPGGFAGWFSGELVVRGGKAIWSEDDNYFMESESETVYTLRNGHVIRRQDYVCRHDHNGKTIRRLQCIAPETPIFTCNIPPLVIKKAEKSF